MLVCPRTEKVHHLRLVDWAKVDVDFTATASALQWYFIVQQLFKINTINFYRSDFSNDIFVQLLDPRDVRCYFPGHVSLCLTALLAVHLPWIKTGACIQNQLNFQNSTNWICLNFAEWETYPDVLLAQSRDCGNALDVCGCDVHMARVQWAERPYLQLQTRHRQLLCEILLLKILLIQN